MWATRPVLEDLTDAARASAHLVVRENAEQVRMLMIVEPRQARMHVAFRSGQLDPIGRGSAGLAMLAAAPPLPGEREEVTRARERGFAVSSGEIAPGITGISAVVPTGRDAQETSIGLSLFEALPRTSWAAWSSRPRSVSAHCSDSDSRPRPRRAARSSSFAHRTSTLPTRALPHFVPQLTTSYTIELENTAKPRLCRGDPDTAAAMTRLLETKHASP
jgi:hypothetical protein